MGASNAALSAALRPHSIGSPTKDARARLVVAFSTGNLGYLQFTKSEICCLRPKYSVGASINSNPTSPVNSDQADPNGNSNNIAVAVDTRTLYNPFGPEMDIVAPSHTCYSGGALVDPTTSTVRVGNGTIDGCPGAPVCNDYATISAWTSHASRQSQARRVDADCNPLLAWNEVKEISATDASGLIFANADPSASTTDMTVTVWRTSPMYGCGRVDVAAATEGALLLYVAS